MKLIKFFIIFILSIIIALSGGYLFRNNILTYLGERYLSISNGALVEIEGLDNEIFTLNLNIDKLKITNKENLMENILDVEGIKFSFELQPLFAGKYIINKMSIDKVEMNTNRKTEGKLPKKWTKIENEEDNRENENKFIKDIENYINDKVEDEKKKIAIMNLDGDNTQEKLNEILDILDLNLQKEYEKNKKYLEERVVFWQEKIESNTYEEDLKNIENKIKNLDYDFDRIKDIKSIEQLKEEEKITKKKIEEMKKLVEETKKVISNIETDKKLLEKEIRDLDKMKDEFVEVANSDYDKVKLLIDLDENSLIGLSTALLGDRVTNYIAMGLEKYKEFKFLQKNKKEIDEEINKKEKMPELPMFWIKETSIKYIGNGKEYLGSITNISSNQDRTKSPIILVMKDHKESTINIIYDNREEKNEVKVNFVSNNINIKDKYIKESTGILKGSFLLKGMSLDGSMELTFNKFILNNKEIFEKGKYTRILDRVTKEIDKTKVLINIKYTKEDKMIKVKSNLDEELYKNIKNILNQEVEELKRELEKRAKAKIEEYKEKLIVEVGQEADKIGIAFGQEEAEAIKNVENLEDLKVGVENYYSKVEEEYKKRLLEKFIKEKKEYISKLKKEASKIGLKLTDEHYKALDKATNLEELKRTGQKIVEDIKEEKKDEAEKKLEEKAKELGEKLKGKFKF